MFEVSWAEIAVLLGTGVVLTGRRDLPAASRFMGHQIGRVVGFIQGARARADQFAAQSELRHLQDELRSGLRELDQVKTELAVAARASRGYGSARGAAVVVGRSGGIGSSGGGGGLGGLGGSIAANAQSAPPGLGGTSEGGVADLLSAQPTLPTTAVDMGRNVGGGQPDAGLAAARLPGAGAGAVSAALAPAIETERATMEIEWERQGIGYKSIAEKGLWLGSNSGAIMMANGTRPAPTTGSEILAGILQETLVFDQYDRVVGQQEAETQRRIEEMRQIHGRNAKNVPLSFCQ